MEKEGSESQGTLGGKKDNIVTVAKGQELGLRHTKETQLAVDILSNLMFE